MADGEQLSNVGDAGREMPRARDRQRTHAMARRQFCSSQRADQAGVPLGLDLDHDSARGDYVIGFSKRTSRFAAEASESCQKLSFVTDQSGERISGNRRRGPMPGRRLLSDADVIAANEGSFRDPASARRRAVLRETITAFRSQDPPDRYHRLAAT